MRKLLILLYIIMFVFPISLVLANDNENGENDNKKNKGRFELGLSVLPYTLIDKNDTTAFKDVDEWVYGGHFGWSPSVLYFSWDAFYLPESIIYDITTKIDEETITPGISDKAGLINFFDVGVRFILFKSMVISAQAGLNYLYIFNQNELESDEKPLGLGTNLKLGIGLKLKNFGFTVSGTLIFASFEDMIDTIKSLRSDDPLVKETAQNKIKILPTFSLMFYF